MVYGAELSRKVCCIMICPPAPSTNTAAHVQRVRAVSLSNLQAGAPTAPATLEISRRASFAGLSLRDALTPLPSGSPVYPHVEEILQQSAIIPSPWTLRCLTGGLTNQTYLVQSAAHSVILQIDGKRTRTLGVSEDKFINAAIAGEMGVAPHVIAILDDQHAIASEFIVGKTLTPADLNDDIRRRQVLATLRMYQEDTTHMFTHHFDPCQPIIACLRQHAHRLPLEIRTYLKRILTDMVPVLKRNAPPPCPSHNDFHSGNIMFDGENIKIIDWEYAGLFDPMYDLATLANCMTPADVPYSNARARLLLTERYPDMLISDEAVARLQRMRLLQEAWCYAWYQLRVDSPEVAIAQMHHEWREKARRIQANMNWVPIR